MTDLHTPDQGLKVIFFLLEENPKLEDKVIIVWKVRKALIYPSAILSCSINPSPQKRQIVGCSWLIIADFFFEFRSIVPFITHWELVSKVNPILSYFESRLQITSTPIITLSMAHPPIYQTTQCSLFSYLVSWTTPCYILKYEYLDLSASEENTGPVSKSQRNREIDMRLCVLGKGPPLSNNLIRCNPFPVLETLFDDKRYLVGAVSSLFGNFVYTTLL